MRIPVWLTVLAALAGLAVMLVIGRLLINPNTRLLAEAGFSLTTITPNADGNDDVTVFSYTLSRVADVSLVFEGADGQRFVFRDNQRRIAGDYSVNFSGVVDGYTLPGEDVPGTVERRLMPDGTYTWRLTAVGVERDETDERTGTLVVQDADTPLPTMSVFYVSPDTFTPNQDSVHDRVKVQVFLDQPADLSVNLVSSDGARIPISALQEGFKLGDAGRFIFDYAGGIDLGADPPPDGTYTVVATAQDAVGQRTSRTTTLTIADGGKPRAQIMPQAVGVDVVFDVQPYDPKYFSTRDHPGERIPIPDNPEALGYNDITVPLGDMLVFRLTVQNYSDVPIRTTGPAPGTVYDQDQLAATLGDFEESGAWRVGIQCDTSGSSYPYRWAVGTDDQLITQTDPDNGNVYHYLPAGAQAVVWGAIHITKVDNRNPQNCWAGLIQEDVAVINADVGIRSVDIVDPAGGRDN